MKSKLVLSLSILTIVLKSYSQPVITNVFYNIGTNGYDLFSVTVLNTDPNMIYGWEKSTNLLSDWSLTLLPFQGSSLPEVFYEPITHGDTNAFYRVVTIAHLIKTAPFIDFGTNNVSIHHFPSTNFPPMP